MFEKLLNLGEHTPRFTAKGEKGQGISESKKLRLCYATPGLEVKPA